MRLLVLWVIEEKADQTEAVVRLEVRSEVPERPLHLHHWRRLVQTLLTESSGKRFEEGGTEAQGRRWVMRMHQRKV